MSRKTYCSGCGKEIAGACQECRLKTQESLAARRRIPPGCPKIPGEFRAFDLREPHPLSRDVQFLDSAKHRKPTNFGEDGNSFDNAVRAYEDLGDSDDE